MTGTGTPASGAVDCAICTRLRDGRPHEGSVGGTLYEDSHWYAYHAPIASAMAGQLFLVSKRHYLDFAEMTPDEATSYGLVLRRLYAALKRVTGAERIYAQVTLEGVPYFHVWLIPRPADATERGWDYVIKERSCTEAEALAIVAQLRDALGE